MLVPYYSTSNPSLVLFSLYCTRNLFFHLCTRFLFTPGHRNTLQYREAVIRNFANKIVDVWHRFTQLEICIKKVYHKLTWRLFLLTKKLLLLLTNPGILFILAFFTFIVLVQKSFNTFAIFSLLTFCCYLYSTSTSAHGCQFSTHS